MLQLLHFLLGQLQQQLQHILTNEHRGRRPRHFDARPMAMLSPQAWIKIGDRFSVVPLSDTEFRLHSLTTSLAIKSSAPGLLERLFPLLNGTRTVDEILRELVGFGAEDVRASLHDLADAGVLEATDPGSDELELSVDEQRRFRDQIAFFSHFAASFDSPENYSPVGALPRKAAVFQQRLQRARVAVFGLGRLGSQLARLLALSGIGAIIGVDSELVTAKDLESDAWFSSTWIGADRAEAVRNGIEALGVGVSFRFEPAPNDDADLQTLLAGCGFAVLCPDRYDPREYSTFNRAAAATKTSWTSARFAGFEFSLGPTVIPGQTSCFECFRLRVNSNVADYDEHVLLESWRERRCLREEALAITPGVGLLALEVVKALTWFTPPTTCGQMYSLDLLTLRSELHPVLRLPRCPVCGRPAMPRPTIHAWQQTQADPAG